MVHPSHRDDRRHRSVRSRPHLLLWSRIPRPGLRVLPAGVGRAVQRVREAAGRLLLVRLRVPACGSFRPRIPAVCRTAATLEQPRDVLGPAGDRDPQADGHQSRTLFPRWRSTNACSIRERTAHHRARSRCCSLVVRQTNGYGCSSRLPTLDSRSTATTRPVGRRAPPYADVTGERYWTRSPACRLPTRRNLRQRDAVPRAVKSEHARVRGDGLRESRPDGRS